MFALSHLITSYQNNNKVLPLWLFPLLSWSVFSLCIDIKWEKFNTNHSCGWKNVPKFQPVEDDKTLELKNWNLRPWKHCKFKPMLLWTLEIFMECYCLSRKKPIKHEKPKPQAVTVTSLWFHVAFDWLLHNGKCQNQIKVFTVFGFAQ